MSIRSVNSLFPSYFRHELTELNMRRIKACLGHFNTTFKYYLTNLAGIDSRHA